MISKSLLIQILSKREFLKKDMLELIIPGVYHLVKYLKNTFLNSYFFHTRLYVPRRGGNINILINYGK